MPLSFTNPGVLWLLVPFLVHLGLPLVGRVKATPGATGRRRVDELRRAASGRQWAGIGLRLAIGLGLILALSGARWVQPVEDLAVVFVLDLSDSVPSAEKERAEDFIREAVAGLQSHG